jgi:hypothetical protein
VHVLGLITGRRSRPAPNGHYEAGTQVGSLFSSLPRRRLCRQERPVAGHGLVAPDPDVLAHGVAVDAAVVSVQQADIDRMRSLGLTDTDILDVVLAAAARCFFSKTLDALGVQPDAKLRRTRPPVREALTVGRAIAGR